MTAPITTEELRKPLRIYTEQTSDVGGLWAFEPYAMFHVEFVESGDYIAERNRSEALAAELNTARETLEEWKASQHYSYIGADGKTVKARDLEDELITARAKLEAAEKLAEAAEVVTRSMRAMLEAYDAIRNLSSLGRASLTGEVLAAEVAIAAWEASQ